MAAILGKVEEFDQSKEEWTQYVERLNHFFLANAIENADKKRAVFLSVIGPAVYKMLASLLAPVKPGEKTYEELVTSLQKQYDPKPSEIVQRFKFHSRVRKEGESVSSYVAELRSLAQFCNFGASLEDMLRDRIVCGINDVTAQKRLLAERDLTYQKALDLARGQEVAAQSLKEIRGPKQAFGSVSQDVNKVHATSGKGAASGAKAAWECYRCGKPGHLANECKFKEAKCHQCGKIGHLKQVCRSQGKGPKKQGQPFKQHSVCRFQEEEEEEEGFPLYHIGSKKKTHPPLEAQVQMDDCPVTMEIDTGATLSLMAETMFRQLWPRRSLNVTTVRLCSYSKEPITVLGSVNVNTSYKGQTAQLPLLVVKGKGPTLLGRNWLEELQLDWKAIHQVGSSGLERVLSEHQAVFQEGLGALQGFQAHIEVELNATPKFCKARTVPYALKDKVEEALQKLVGEGILEPVQFSNWAAPIVPVLKSDKTTVRICGDFRTTVNPVSKLDRYPIPKIEDLFATLEQGKMFTKLDLSQAYQQLTLDEESKKYVVVNTHKGLFRYTRLPYGISSAPGIFQRVMENLLQGLDGVIVFIDDILITGSTEAEHLQRLGEVLRRLEQAGLRVKKGKCQFLAPAVTYLGHRIDAEGLHPLPDKVKAVHEAPAPRDVTELKSFLGLLTYYGKFLPKLATHLAPLYGLLKKDHPWKWGQQQKDAFQKSKELLTSSRLLVHFDPKLDLILACDASAYGIGAVLAHRMPDGTEKPVGYASRTLSKAERNYSQLEKEGLSCIFGIKRFHQYLFGHPFQLITDHKPLLGLLSEHKTISPQASARIKRWSLLLAAYEYTLSFRDTQSHGNADALSRLPLPTEPAKEEITPELVLLAEHLEESLVTADHIRVWTEKDSVLSQVVQFLQQGWPAQCDSQLSAFSSKQAELSLYEGCILWGSRVVVPEQGRKAVLTELHEGHPGIARMKALSRMYVWWPGISSDVEQLVKGCVECQQTQSLPPAAPLRPWSWPTRPWARVHLDYAGPVAGKMFLVLIDAHSKWIEVFNTPSATSEAVMGELRTTFARFGIPETVVTDNGTCFVSAEFEHFLVQNGIRHITSAPYHPASNGLAERAVQIVKKGLKKVTEGSVTDRLAKVLFAYRITPQGTTGVSPAELLLGHRPRTRLDLVKPHTAERVEKKQQEQKQKHDATARDRSFQTGDLIWMKNYGTGDKWLPGVVESVIGPVNFNVKLEDGRMRRCHTDQLRQRQDSGLPLAVVPPTLVEVLPEVIDVGETSPPALAPATPATPATPPPVSTPAAERVATPVRKKPALDQPVKEYPLRNRMAQAGMNLKGN